MPSKALTRTKMPTFIRISVAVVFICFGIISIFFSSPSLYDEEVNLSVGAIADAGDTLDSGHHYQCTPELSGFSSLLSLPGSTSTEPTISAASAILIECDSGHVIWEKNADKRMPMASTTKIMTALVAIERCDTERIVEISPLAIGIEGSSIYLYAGERLSMEDLLYAMLLESANDAAAAIAIEVGGSIEGFADMMNQKAAELGLKNTHFTNPHGLDDPEHYTTASELATIAMAAMQNQTFKEIVGTYKKTIPLNETEGVRLLINHNKMLKMYDGACGVKTGYTKKSGRCLVSAATRDNVDLLAVTLNAPSDWSDHKELFDYGFSLFESRILCGQGEFRYSMPVISGNDSYVVLENTTDVSVTVPRGYGEIDCEVYLPRFIFAPVSAGDIVGTLIYKLDGKVIATCPIEATFDVTEKTYKKSLWDLLF